MSEILNNAVESHLMANTMYGVMNEDEDTYEYDPMEAAEARSACYE